MKGFRISILGCALAFGVIALSLSARADQWNKKTIITINDSLQIPGAVLTPGTYVFKLVDSQSNRHIVRVMNEGETKVIATILAIPNYRLQPTGKTEFGFWEMPKGSPAALRAWFYPGDNFGQEFAYPTAEATSIASATQMQPPTVTAEEQAQVAQTEVAEAPPAPEPAPAPAPEVAEAAPAPEPPPVVEPAPAPALEVAREEPAPAPEPATLPRTASDDIIFVLAGVAALGLGVILHAFRQGLA